MPEKVKSQIFEIVATENLCFDNTLTALGDVVFKMLGKLVLTTIIFKYGGYECRKWSKLKYFKSLSPKTCVLTVHLRLYMV